METWQEIHRKKHRAKSRRRLLILLLVLILFVLAGGFAFRQYRDRKAAEESFDPKEPAEGEQAFYARLLSIYGNEVTYEREDTGEEVRTCIPVGTCVTTQLGASATFSRLAVGDRLLIIAKEDTGEMDRIFMAEEEQSEKMPAGERDASSGEAGGGPSGGGRPTGEGPGREGSS